MSGTEAAMENGKRPIRKFNPGLFQSDEEVIAQFAVRQHEFEIVSEVLRNNISAPSCQHTLIVAPRGRGKTMLLARVAAELRGNPQLSSHLLPVRFMEESQEVYDLAGFWLETLFHLSREIAADHPEFARDLSETHGSLSSRWREEGMEGIARAAVLDAADRLGRRLVLMVENLQSLCEAVDEEFGWQLRGVLQSEPQIVLLASATSRFEGLEDAGEPFFEMFRIVQLPPLTTEECRRLWTIVSGQEPGRHEIRPLEILTGGSPRLLVVVAAFARHRSFRQLMEELVGLVDEHTEYFRGHLESLPKSERRVYVALIDLWQPSSTGEIAARARLDVRVVSTMLGRLVDRGAVTAEPAGGGRKRLYAASERLYSIYYKLRRERDEAAVVEALIRFMVVFYEVGEVWRISGQLFWDALESRVIHTGIDRALAGKPTLDDLAGMDHAQARKLASEDLGSLMKWIAIRDLSNKVSDSRRADALTRLQENIQAAFAQQDWRRVLEIIEQYVAHGWLDSEIGHAKESSWTYLAHMRSNAHLMLGELEQVITIGNEVATRLSDTREMWLIGRSCAVALNKATANLRLGNLETAKTESKRLVEQFAEYGTQWFQQAVAAALLLQARAENELGNFGDAIALLDEVLVRYGESGDQDVQVQVARSLNLKADIVRWRQDGLREAATIYMEAIRKFGQSEQSELREHMANARINRAFACAAIGEFDEEIASYDELIVRLDDIDTLGDKWTALVALGFKARRLAELGMADEALRACDDYARWVETSTDESRAWMEWHEKGSRALAWMSLGESGFALDAFRSAYSLYQPRFEMAMEEMFRLVPELIATGAAEQDLVEILAGDHRKSHTLRPMIVALQQRAGETVRAPVEVLQVADDMRKSIEERIAKGVMPGFMLRLGQ